MIYTHQFKFEFTFFAYVKSKYLWLSSKSYRKGIMGFLIQWNGRYSEFISCNMDKNSMDKNSNKSNYYTDLGKFDSLGA